MERKKRNIVMVSLSLIVLLGAIYFIYLQIPSKEKMNYNVYFNRSNEQVGLIVNHQVLEVNGIKENGIIYLPLQQVQDYISTRFYWDGEQLLYALPTKVLQIGVGEDTYQIDDMETKLSSAILLNKNDSIYIALDFITSVYSVTSVVNERENFVWIWSDWEGEVIEGIVKKESSIHYKKNIKSPMLELIQEGDTVFILKEEKEFSLVQLKSGVIGYIKTKWLQEDRVSTHMTGDYVVFDYPSLTREEQIVMAWQQNLTNSGIDSLESIIEKTKGVLNTISPSWFTVTDENGTFESRGSKEYVKKAHENGLEVWAMIDNINVSIDSHKLLSSTQARTSLIEGLIKEAKKLGIDGINLDFEKIKKETGVHYIQFVRELSSACRNEKLVLSIDNYVPSTSTDYYDRKEQGIVADYVVIMGYDEHWAGGMEAGSTASKEFVKKGIEDTLLEVKKEKVINAIPFYTRLWCETPAELSSPNAKIIEDENSKYERFSLTSEAKGMKSSVTLLEEKGITPVWDEQVGQYYAEYEENNQFYRIWLEEETSLKEKLEIIKGQQIAGISAWKLGLEDDYVWELIGEYF